MASTNNVTRSSKLGPEERAAALDADEGARARHPRRRRRHRRHRSALDAVTRGLSVGMLEARDWASGTSSRSSKLVHGGIRYLEQLDFRLVREALIERGLLLQRIAPHLVKPVRFLYPLKKRVFERFYIGAGMLLYDLFSYTGGRPPGVPHHRHLHQAPGAARHPVALQRRLHRRHHLLRRPGRRRPLRRRRSPARPRSTAPTSPPACGSRASSRSASASSACTRTTWRPASSSRSGPSRSSTRPASGPTTPSAWWASAAPFKVRASKGIHLVVPRDRFQSTIGLLLRTEKSVLFVIPWGRHWLIGTTDTDWNLDKAHPAATAADIDYLLEHVNSVLAIQLTREDVEGVYAGLRPLLAGESEQTSKLSREHIVAHTVPGLVVSPAASGPPTASWRRTRSTRPPTPSTARSRRRPREDIAAARRRGLPGGVEQARQDRAGVRRAQGAHRAPAQPLRHADRRAARPDPRASRRCGEPLPGADDYLAAEVVYAASHEGALHLEDVLARRTRISIEAWDRGVSAAPGRGRSSWRDVLGWDEERRQREVDHYLKRVAAERASAGAARRRVGRPRAARGARHHRGRSAAAPTRCRAGSAACAISWGIVRRPDVAHERPATAWPWDVSCCGHGLAAASGCARSPSATQLLRGAAA